MGEFLKTKPEPAIGPGLQQDVFLGQSIVRRDPPAQKQVRIAQIAVERKPLLFHAIQGQRNQRLR
jgi:hypothetical protein